MFWSLVFLGFLYFFYKIFRSFRPLIELFRRFWSALFGYGINVLLYVLSGNPALHDSALPALLLFGGADPNFRLSPMEEVTTLVRAVRSAKSDRVLERLARAGGNLRWCNRKGGTLLHFAAREANLVSVAFLIREKLQVNARDAAGETPLMSAVRAWRQTDGVNVLWLLRENGADALAVNSDDATILHILVDSAKTAPSDGVSSPSQTDLSVQSVQRVVSFAIDVGVDHRRRNCRGETAAEAAAALGRGFDTLRSALERPVTSLGFQPFSLTTDPFGGRTAAPLPLRTTPPSYGAGFSSISPSESVPSPVVPSAPSQDNIGVNFGSAGDAAEATAAPGAARSNLADAECCICLDRVTETALVPCGHCVCDDCAGDLNFCPICRQRVRETLRIYK